VDAASLARWSERIGLPVPIRFVEVTGSTNADLKALADQGAPAGTTLVAGTQTAGRGRLGRTWEMAPGAGLALSILLRPALSLDRAPLANLAAAVATAEVCGPEYRIKWPNDVLGLDGSKVAGILAEVEADGSAVRWIVVGLGINVSDAPVAYPHAGALEQIDGRPRDHARLAAEIAAGVLHAVDRLTRVPGEILGVWRARSATLGARVQVGEIRGVAIGLDPDGALRVRDDQGAEHRIVSGDL
jgi:BirA family biotin operon repressor/biotin-[acetyl-CoA-carboxylase] ligase